MADPTDSTLAIDPDRLEAGAIAKVVEKVLGGDNDAAVVLQRLLKPHLERKAAETHDAKVRDCLKRGATQELAHYLGEYGESEVGMSIFLNRQATEKELDAYAKGKAFRQLEIRALQLSRARSGGPIERWMSQ